MKLEIYYNKKYIINNKRIRHKVFKLIFKENFKEKKNLVLKSR